MLAHAHPRLASHWTEWNVRVLMRAAYTLMRQAICSLGGHDYLLHATRNRIFLQCSTCGRETPGWRVDLRFVKRATKATIVSAVRH